MFVLGHILKDEVPQTIDNLCAAVKPGGYLVIAEFDAISEHMEGHSEEDKFVSEGGNAHTTISAKDIREGMIRNGLDTGEGNVTRFTMNVFGGETKAMIVVGSRK